MSEQEPEILVHVLSVPRPGGQQCGTYVPPICAYEPESGVAFVVHDTERSQIKARARAVEGVRALLGAARNSMADFSANKMRAALEKIRSRALLRAPGAQSEFSPATAASLAHICEEALEPVRDETLLARVLAACTKTWMREEPTEEFGPNGVYLKATLPDGKIIGCAYSEGSPDEIKYALPEQLAADTAMRRRVAIDAMARKLAKHIIEAAP